MNHEALRRKALAMGAKLEMDGKVFNAARVEGTHTPKVVPIKPLQKLPEPTPPIELPKANDEYISASLALVDKQSQVLESNAKLMALMTHQLTKPEAKKSKGWVFKINRDPANGNMTSIEATPKE